MKLFLQITVVIFLPIIINGGISFTTRGRFSEEILEQCPENMLLYPRNKNRSEWICDCKPRFIYFSTNNTCYEAYKQGPCPSRHIVIFPPGEEFPKCIENSCLEVNYVPFNKTCVKINSVGGICGAKKMFAINEYTFQLECFSIGVDPFYIVGAPPKEECPVGSKRTLLGVCKKDLKEDSN